jgi:MFS family permease
MRIRVLVLGWLCLAAAIAYLQRNAIGVVAIPIRAEFRLDERQMGWIMSAYYWCYALCQLPAGWLVARFGPLRMLCGGVLLASSCAAVGGLAPNGLSFGIAWSCAGIAIAGIFPACVQTIMAWFPASNRALPSGFLGSSMSLGGAASTFLAGWLVVELADSGVVPWRGVFVLFAVPGIVWTLVVWFRLKERPTVDPRVSAAELAELATPAATKATSTNFDDSPWWLDPRAFAVCGQQFFRAAGYIFYATWFPTFLIEAKGTSLAEAGTLASLPLLAVVVGGSLGGWLWDRLERVTGGDKRASRQLPAIVCHTSCGGLILFAQQVDDPVRAVALIAAGSFLFALASPCSYAVSMDLGGRRAATLFATMNMCGNIGAAICPVVVAVIVKSHGWNAVLPFFAGLYFATAGCWLLLDPRPRGIGDQAK